MSIGSKIAQYRKQLNITQDALAQKLQVTNQAVSKWESDQCCPDISLLPRLADIFGISIDELFGREPQPVPQQEVPVIQGLPWPDDRVLRAVVYVGHRLHGCEKARKGLILRFGGNVDGICADMCVQCGSVEGDVDAAGSVTCDTVGGSVDAGTSVTCGNVDGSVDAGTYVTCQDVGGDVDAGTNVKCGNVDGSVDAGCHVTCQDIGGDVDAGANVTCSSVAGDIDAGGSVTIKK